MKRQVLKVLILLFAVLTLSTGGKALQINSEQKFQLNDLTVQLNEKEKELGSLISIQKIIIMFFYVQRQPFILILTFINHHKSLFLKPTNIICRQAEDTSIRFFVNY